jgi:hypothetical protein
MATFVRNRVLNQLEWSEEENEMRLGRRNVLCQLDGLLGQLEEINLRGGAIPPRVLLALRRVGIPTRDDISPTELIESIFLAQEGFMRQPEAAQESLTINELRRRLAS